MTVLQEQSAQNDAQEFEDLVATFNAQITGRTKDIERGWMFTILKTAQDLGEAIEKPFSTALGTALKIAETATDDYEIKPGPVAFFHHVKK